MKTRQKLFAISIIMMLFVVGCTSEPLMKPTSVQSIEVSSETPTVTPSITLTSTSTTTPTPLPPPLWLSYDDQDISFQYPKTLCGTSWQEDWDIYSCDEAWRVERTPSAYSSGDYAGAQDYPTGAYIHIMPAYSSFGFEFGGDLQIVFVSENDFHEATQGRSLPQQTTRNGYSVFIEEGIEGYPGKANRYHLTNNASYLLIHNNFPDRYPSYIPFLLDSIKLK